MSKSTIVPLIFGGLGNQLFCYAAARRMAVVNEAALAIDSVSGFLRDHKYQRQNQLQHFNIPCREATYAERLEPFSRLRRKILRVTNNSLPFSMRGYIQQEGVDFDHRILDVTPARITYLEGYWQSENYFKDIESVIRSDLRIKPPTDSENLTMLGSINNIEAVAVHVRFFDMLSDGVSNNVSSEYYRRAIEEMNILVPGAHYFVFSDRPESVPSIIPLANSRVTIVKHNQGDENSYKDLWLMTKCQHFIIANSTFSWWGAWLSSNLEKNVIAPKLEIKEGVAWWGFDGLIPSSWITL